jgi:hypothetical protein
MSFFNQSQHFLLIRQNEMSPAEREMITDFVFDLKNEKKEGIILVWHNKKKLPDNTSAGPFEIHLCKKDFNIFGKPSSEKIVRLMNNQFDYIINTAPVNIPKIEKVISKIRASIKIGRYHSVKIPELYSVVFQNADTTENNIEDFFISLGKYISKIEIYETQ